MSIALCAMEEVSSMVNYFPLLCFIVHHDSEGVQKKLTLTKVKSFTEAREIARAEE